MSSPDNQTRYWDSNLDPANLEGLVRDDVAALRREVSFAEHTPDIQQMMEFLGSNALIGEGRQWPLIADVGAGLGTTAVLLRRRGFAVVALDISHNRLAVMRRAVAAMGGDAEAPPIFAVKCRAEALPFRDGALDGACTRAVLIHTDLSRACAEINRALQAGAPVAFAEVMADNPLVNFYRRTLAPREWKEITTYFTAREIEVVRGHFQGNHARYYYVVGFAAFVFQYAMPVRRVFVGALKLLTRVDGVAGKALRSWWRRAWFVLITGKATKR